MTQIDDTTHTASSGIKIDGTSPTVSSGIKIDDTTRPASSGIKIDDTTHTASSGIKIEGVRARGLCPRGFPWLDRPRLLYDISNYAYIEGHKLESTGSTAEAAHLLTDICAEGNIDRVNQVLDLGCATLTSLLATVPVARHCQAKPWIHEYLVCLVLADWLEIVHAPAAGVWREKGAKALATIRSALLGVHGPRRRPTAPW